MVSEKGVDNIKNYLNEKNKVLLKTIDTYPYEDTCLIFANYITKRNKDVFGLTLKPNPEAVKKACELAKIDSSNYLENENQLKSDKFNKTAAKSTLKELQEKLLIDETNGIYRDIKTLDAIKNEVQKLNRNINKNDTEDDLKTTRFNVSGDSLNGFLKQNGIENSLETISDDDIAKLLKSLLANNKDSKKEIISALFQLNKNK